MALIKPTGEYVRVEDVRIGKGLVQFTARTYTELTAPAVDEETFVAPYDLDGKNPLVQSYEFLAGVTKYSNCVSDTTPKRKKGK